MCLVPSTLYLQPDILIVRRSLVRMQHHIHDPRCSKQFCHSLILSDNCRIGAFHCLPRPQFGQFVLWGGRVAVQHVPAPARGGCAACAACAVPNRHLLLCRSVTHRRGSLTVTHRPSSPGSGARTSPQFRAVKWCYSARRDPGSSVGGF